MISAGVFHKNFFSLEIMPKMRGSRKSSCYKKIYIALRAFNFKVISGLLPIVR